MSSYKQTIEPLRIGDTLLRVLLYQEQCILSNRSVVRDGFHPTYKRTAI